jgi:hypothetical protein
LKTYLIEPYSRTQLSFEETLLDYTLSRAKCTVENGFGVPYICKTYLEVMLRILEVPGLILIQGTIYPESSIRCIIHNNYQILRSANIMKATH